MSKAGDNNGDDTGRKTRKTSGRSADSKIRRLLASNRRYDANRENHRSKNLNVPQPVPGSDGAGADGAMPDYLGQFPSPIGRATAVQALRNRLTGSGQWESINALSSLTAERSRVRHVKLHGVVEAHRVEEDQALLEGALAILDLASVLPLGFGHADGSPDRGSIFRPVQGRPETGHEASTRGLKEFGWHCDWAALAFPDLALDNECRSPDWVLLICQRNPDKIGTMVLVGSKVLPDVSMLSRHVMTCPEFYVPAPGNIDAEFAAKAVPALEFTAGRAPLLRHHPDMVGLTPRAKAALAELREVLDSHKAEEVILSPGDALVISNSHTLHARRAVTPNRQLVAVYGRLPLHKGPGFADRPFLERYAPLEDPGVHLLR